MSLSNNKVKRSREDFDDDTLVYYDRPLPKIIEENKELCEEYRWLCGSLRNYYDTISGYKIVLCESDAKITIDGTLLKMIVVFKNNENFATEIFELCKIVSALNSNYTCYISPSKDTLMIECQRNIEPSKNS
jgi:hypothetical protein